MRLDYRESNKKISKELKQEISMCFPKGTPDCIRKKLHLHKMVENNFIKQELILKSQCLDLIDSQLTIDSSSIGLATTLTGAYNNRHQAQLQQHRFEIKLEQTPSLSCQKNMASRNHINLLAALASHQVGIGYFHLMRFFAFIGIYGLHQHGYKK